VGACSACIWRSLLTACLFAYQLFVGVLLEAFGSWRAWTVPPLAKDYLFPFSPLRAWLKVYLCLFYHPSKILFWLACLSPSGSLPITEKSGANACSPVAFSARLAALRLLRVPAILAALRRLEAFVAVELLVALAVR
jgi:hypothetical protein